MNSNNLVDWHRICVKYMYSTLGVSRYFEICTRSDTLIAMGTTILTIYAQEYNYSNNLPVSAGLGATYPENELDTAQLAMVRMTSLPRFTHRVTHQRPGRPMHNVFVVLLVSQLAYRVVSFREKEIYIRASLLQVLHNTL